MKSKPNHCLMVFTFILLFSWGFKMNAQQVVQTEKGSIRGISEGNVIAFKGIPFASPPVGELRWRPPQPVKSWDGILEAFQYKPACPQINVPGAGNDTYGFSEDCLYLNIWRPENTSTEKLPVLVWIYGGGFYIGSASTAVTTGEVLAQTGLIVVNISYRTGPLGFLVHPGLSDESDHHISGNYGLLDQLAALQWIQDNIEAFGGDPDNVTIFGESAGGQSVSMLAASPLARGLFHKAICMSGGSFYPVSLEKDPENYIQLMEGAEKEGMAFADRLGATSVDDLRKIPPEELLSDPAASLGGFWPVVDQYVITGDQYLLYKEGAFNDIPVLLGFTSDEGTLFTMQDVVGDYEKETRQRFGDLADEILKFYPAGNDSLNRRSNARLFRDLSFGWPAYTWARLQTEKGRNPVFLYYFDQLQPESILTMLLNSNGAYHGSDVAYVFGHLDRNPMNPMNNYTEADRRLSGQMIRYWTNFAKSGNPNGDELPEWPLYSMDNPTVMLLKADPDPGQVPFPILENMQVLDDFFSWKRETAKR